MILQQTNKILSHGLTIAIGADHRGVKLKSFLIQLLSSSTQSKKNITLVDVGCSNPEYCDYPKYAIAVVQEIISQRADCGILICGTGAGVAITANRFDKIYAALAFNVETARLAREHDNANILVLPADYVTLDQAFEMTSAWLDAKFISGKYQNRLTMIDNIK